MAKKYYLVEKESITLIGPLTIIFFRDAVSAAVTARMFHVEWKYVFPIAIVSAILLIASSLVKYRAVRIILGGISNLGYGWLIILIIGVIIRLFGHEMPDPLFYIILLWSFGVGAGGHYMIGETFYELVSILKDKKSQSAEQRTNNYSNPTI